MHFFISEVRKRSYKEKEDGPPFSRWSIPSTKILIVLFAVISDPLNLFKEWDEWLLYLLNI